MTIRTESSRNAAPHVIVRVCAVYTGIGTVSTGGDHPSVCRCVGRVGLNTIYFFMWLSRLVSHLGASHGEDEPVGQQGAKSAATEAERKLIQVGLKMILGQAMVGSQNKRLSIADHNMQPVEHTAIRVIGLMFMGVILKRRDITAVAIAADSAASCNGAVSKLSY